MEQKLGFIEFIQKYFPQYQIDSENESQILMVAAWAERDENFSKMGERFHLDRGLLLSGGVGVGKTDLFSILNKYLREYLRSPYAYRYHVAWKYASEFAKEGHKAFENIENGNRYFDELCLTDVDGGEPTREFVNFFGNKILIGTEIIMCRYNALKNFGLQTHFSTNATPGQLAGVYKERAFDRLVEMCNFIVFNGKSRRWMHDPTLHQNLNKPLRVFESRPVSDEEHKHNKIAMDEMYQSFLTSGRMSELASIHYDILKSYNCNIGGDDVIEKYASESSETYFPKPNVIKSLSGDNYELMSQTESEKERNARLFSIKQAKTRCVYEFYTMLKAAGAKSIFNEVNVKVSDILPGAASE